MAELRRSALRRLPLFGIIAICFFLPCVHSCEAAVSPLGQIAHHGADWKAVSMDAAWVLPPFVSAVVIAVLLAIVARRPESADVLALVAGVTLLGWMAGLPVTIAVVFHTSNARDMTWLVLGFAALPEVMGALCGWRLLRARGWARWDWVTIAWAALAAASPVGALIAMELRDEIANGKTFLPGAALYVVSVRGLLVGAIRSLRRVAA